MATKDLDTTVVGLQGQPISSTPPSGGQALVFNGAEWIPENLPAGGASIGSTPPASPGEGDLWFDTGNNTLNVWNGSTWVPVSAASGATVTISDTAPANPEVGDLWWDSVGGQLYIYYEDPSSSQWVVTNSTGSAGTPIFLPLSGGTLSGPLIPAGGIVGVTDGSNAAAGQVGEWIEDGANGAAPINLNPTAAGTLVTLFSIDLTPGDWDVSTFVAVDAQGATNAQTFLTDNEAAPPAEDMIFSGFYSNTGALSVGFRRFNITTPTTVYTIANIMVAISTPCVVWGSLAARRVR